MHFTEVHRSVLLLGLCSCLKYISLTTISRTPKGKCYFVSPLLNLNLQHWRFFIYFSRCIRCFVKMLSIVTGFLMMTDLFWLVLQTVCVSGKMWAVRDVEGKSWPDIKDGVKLHTEPPALLLSLTSPCSHKGKLTFQSWIPQKIPASL